MLIWRPIMARRLTLGEVTRGEADLVHIVKLNALLDMEAAQNHAAAEKAKKR